MEREIDFESRTFVIAASGTKVILEDVMSFLVMDSQTMKNAGMPFGRIEVSRDSEGYKIDSYIGPCSMFPEQFLSFTIVLGEERQ